MCVGDLIDEILLRSKSGTEITSINCLIALEIIDGILCTQEENDEWCKAEKAIDEVKKKISKYIK